MNHVTIGGYIKSIQFRGSARNKQLCADVVMDVVDEVRPDKVYEIHFTDSTRAKDWRRIELESYAEVQGKLVPAKGLTSNGNVGDVCKFMPVRVRAKKIDIEREESDIEWARRFWMMAMEEDEYVALTEDEEKKP